MQALDPVETVLARLMPPALSQDCQMDLEAMLDELAGDSENPSKPRQYRWWIGGGIAAALAAIAAVFPLWQDSPRIARVMPVAPGLELVSGSGRIESVTDEGWHEDSNGFAMRALRLNVVEEDSVRDVESGMVVQISQPREEILLMPVTAF